MTTTKTTRGFKATCPFCGVLDARFLLHLDEMTKIECVECSEEFTALEARNKIAGELTRWDRLSVWIEAAPVVGE